VSEASPPEKSATNIIDKAKDVAVDVKDRAGGLVDKLGKQIPDSVKGTAVDVKDRAGGLVDKLGKQIPDSVKGPAGDFKDRAGELVEKVKERLGLAEDKSRVTLSDAAPVVPDVDDSTDAGEEL
jgi:hypothetical protein